MHGECRIERTGEKLLESNRQRDGQTERERGERERAYVDPGVCVFFFNCACMVSVGIKHLIYYFVLQSHPAHAVDQPGTNPTYHTRPPHPSARSRIDDRLNGHCFGMFLDAFDCKPGVREPESLGATPHEFVMEGVLFYVDPHNEIALSPQCTAMTVRGDEGGATKNIPQVSVFFPQLFPVG